MTSFPETLADK